MASSVFSFFAFLILAISGAHAADDLCTPSPPRSCTYNDLELLAYTHGPITSLGCNFTLSGGMAGSTFPYSVTSYAPCGLYPHPPAAGLTPPGQGSVVTFSLADKKMATTLAPYPNLGLQAASYHSVLVQANATDQFGSRDIWLMDVADSSGQFVQFEAGLKFMCIGGAATLILIPMEGYAFITETAAFTTKYSGQLLIDPKIGGRVQNSGGLYQQVNVTVNIIYP